MPNNSQNGFNTAAENAYQIIRARILAGDFQPGEKLSRRDMAKLTGVSVIPVIEALHKLERDGLAISMPHWGTRVVEVSETQIRDHFLLREAIECQVARILAGRLMPAQALTLEELAAATDSAYTQDSQNRRFGVHYEFHLKLAEFTECPLLVETLNRCNLFFLLRNALEKRRSQASKLPADWHQRLLNAIRTGDPDHAESVMREHVLDSLRRIDAAPLKAGTA